MDILLYITILKISGLDCGLGLGQLLILHQYYKIQSVLLRLILAAKIMYYYILLYNKIVIVVVVCERKE